jgi:hypothetical protein
MGPFLRRRWFLLLLAASGVLVWLCPAWLGWLRAFQPRLAVAPALFLVAVGLDSLPLHHRHALAARQLGQAADLARHVAEIAWRFG